MSSAAAKPDLKTTLTEYLTCSIEAEPLHKAVSLHPCAHKVNKTTANKIKDLLQNCPFCRTPIQSFGPDYFVRDIVSLVFDEKKIERPLPQVSTKIAKEDAPFKELPYPGGAKYLLKKYDTGESSFSITLYTRTPDPFISEIRISTNFYDKGKITIRLGDWNNPVIPVEKFLKDSGFIHFRSPPPEISDPIELKGIYKILVNNNELPQEIVSFLYEIVKNNGIFPGNFPKKSLDHLLNIPFEKTEEKEEPLPTTSASISTKNIPLTEPPYPPGKANYGLQTYKEREILFRALTPDPFIFEIRFYWRQDRSLFLSLGVDMSEGHNIYSDKQKKQKEYLKLAGIIHADFSCSPTIEDANELKHVYKLLMKNNEFPKDSMENVKNWVDNRNSEVSEEKVPIATLYT